LYMQPVQDLTVEDRVSRTQFQYSLEAADATDLNTWVPRLMQKLQALPQLSDVANDQLTSGLKADLVIDRDTASRLGILPQAIDEAEHDINLPASIHTSFQGTAAAFQNSLSSEPYLILAALVTVYIVLGVLYESYIHPITILSTLPSAGVGAILALILTRNDF